jgi:hypothetical protein
MLFSGRVTVAGECPSLFISHGLVENHRLLDGFIREYVGGARRSDYGTLDHGEPDLQNFFLYWLPNRLTNVAMGTQPAPDRAEVDLATADGRRSRRRTVAVSCLRLLLRRLAAVEPDPL